MDKQWPAGCVWTTRGPCSDQPVDRDLWDTPLRCCLAKQTPLPSPPLTQSAETLTGGPARNLYWQAAITNQSTERMPGSCMQMWQRWGFVVSASQRPAQHHPHAPHPLPPAGPFPKIGDWTFWVNVKHSSMGEAHGRRSAAVCAACRLTCSNFQPSDMVDTICVSSSSWHCSTRYTCLTGTCGQEPVKNVMVTRNSDNISTESQSAGLQIGASHTWDVLQSRSLILSLMSFINDVML